MVRYARVYAETDAFLSAFLPAVPRLVGFARYILATRSELSFRKGHSSNLGTAYSQVTELRRVSMARLARRSASLLFSRRTWAIEKCGMRTSHRRALS